MKLLNHLDHVQMRDGSAFLGDVQNPTFTIETHATGPIKIATARIISIVFRDASTGPQDRVILKDGGQLFGTIQDDVINLDTEDLGQLALQVAEVLAVQFTFG